MMLKVLAPMLNHETRLLQVFDAWAPKHFFSEASFNEVLHLLGAVGPVAFAEIECKVFIFLQLCWQASMPVEFGWTIGIRLQRRSPHY